MLDNTEREERETVTVAGEAQNVLIADSEAWELLETVLGRLQKRDCHTIPVLERGALIGLVTMDNVGEFLMIHAAERRTSEGSRGGPEHSRGHA